LNTAKNSFAGELDRGWWQLLLIAWAGVVAWQLYSHWPQLHWLVLRDTDDNMRLMQVRALLNGQGWYDLRQYRLNPPLGADIHWSRIVDLPIAGLILALKPLVGGPWAERIACGLGPLLPLAVALLGLGATVRRLVHPLAWPLAFLCALLAGAALPMFEPMRIDHHGWQLAMLALTVAGLADPSARRGGLLVGLSSAASLSIGLELMPYVIGAGGILALRWVWARGEGERLALYGMSLAGGCLLGYLGFASYANSALRCDALTPVWLSVMVSVGGLLALIAVIGPADWRLRLVLAGLAGAVVAALFVGLFPQCLGRPEGISDELARNWLNNVREAKPIYQHPLRVALPVGVPVLLGLIGTAVATWRARRGVALVPWATLLAFTAVAGGLLLWQMRSGPPAQLLAVPGMVALAWLLMGWTLAHRSALVRVFGTAGAFVLASGAFIGPLLAWFPIDRPTRFERQVSHAGGSCASLTALAPLDRYAPETIFTFVDLSPRLITLTHHRALAGPYHRNGDAILDVQHGFGGSPERFRAIARAHGATLLLICPNMAESTIYTTRDKGGFYDRLAHGERFDFLEPLPLPAKSPLRLYRITG